MTFPGLEMIILKFHDFSRFSMTVRTLITTPAANDRSWGFTFDDCRPGRECSLVIRFTGKKKKKWHVLNEHKTLEIHRMKISRKSFQMLFFYMCLMSEKEKMVVP